MLAANSPTFLVLVLVPNAARTCVARRALELERPTGLLAAGFQFLCALPLALARNQEVHAILSCPVELVQAKGRHLSCN